MISKEELYERIAMSAVDHLNDAIDEGDLTIKDIAQGEHADFYTYSQYAALVVDALEDIGFEAFFMERTTKHYQKILDGNKSKMALILSSPKSEAGKQMVQDYAAIQTLREKLNKKDNLDE